MVIWLWCARLSVNTLTKSPFNQLNNKPTFPSPQDFFTAPTQQSMKHFLRTLPLFLLLLFICPCWSQITCDPVFPTESDDVTIYYDASQGNGALNGVSPVWAHLGVITTASINPSDWKYVATTWPVNNAAAAMTYVSPNVWKKTFNIRSFFNIPVNEKVIKLAFVFRDASGNTVGRTAKGGDMFYDLVDEDIILQDPPVGTALGINYLGASQVRLALQAPGKQVVHVIGDFNDWQISDAYQMRRSFDGNMWWIDLTGLMPGQPIRFQYLVDSVLKIADPLSTMVLDPWNDAFIPPLTYPNLPAYPVGKTTGIVSVLQTNQVLFNWQATNYVRPKKADLVIYELLMRDFLSSHDYNTLLDTLDYLDKFGVTAIELMPVNEFDGNISWGYNPAFHKAPDKYYGSPESLKMLVDACHQRGIAVILDVVFNHASGSSPLAQLYWDTPNNRPSGFNPWLNPVATHDYNVFHDVNHESTATKTYVKNCLQYWMQEFLVDGFRFDLSKGFTQKNTLGNESALAAYDAGRVAILKDYADFMWSIDPNCHIILEHFADNSEEKELAEYGMMLWGNMWGAYKETALGYNLNADLSGVSYQQRSWSAPHLVGFMESHDEDRIAYELKTYGNALPDYNLKTLPVGMRRMEMLNNLLFTVPGPKMLWQFGELGYDFSIGQCEDGTINPANCRTSPKPIRWDYFQDTYRRHLYDATAALLQLRKNHDVFETTDFQTNINSGLQVRSIFLNDNELNVAVFANVGTTSTTVENPAFQHIGFWFEYYTGDTLFVGSGVPTSFTLDAGEYRLYLDKVVALPDYVQLPVAEPSGIVSYLSIQPNPVQDFFRLNLLLNENTDLYLEMQGVSGNVLYSNKFDNLSAGPQQLQLNAVAWQSGIYFVVVRDAKGNTHMQKFVKVD
jgi:hypothetical protein